MTRLLLTTSQEATSHPSLLLPAAMKLPTLLFVMALKVVPLLVFLLPVRRGRADSAVWLGFLLMFYFCWAVLGAFAHGTEGRLALLRLLLITTCFAAAMLFARWQRALREP